MSNENATTDNSGIVTNPNHSIPLSEQLKPCEQGSSFSGTNPAISSMWKTATNQPSAANGSAYRTTLRSNGNSPIGRITTSGNMKTR